MHHLDHSRFPAQILDASDVIEERVTANTKALATRSSIKALSLTESLTHTMSTTEPIGMIVPRDLEVFGSDEAATSYVATIEAMRRCRPRRPSGRDDEF